MVRIRTVLLKLIIMTKRSRNRRKVLRQLKHSALDSKLSNGKYTYFVDKRSWKVIRFDKNYNINSLYTI